ncbi:conserved Plasmodium protein, unknown function [Plasmodium ovale]|uniref:Uncharacterized protein n=2 Tax=Plasmodium ovale TaxID=36330 RepID=A0A1A8W6X4_PLAOA|nr:conserved Plasmodium protein, unknown function [Plasmodium ovale curtisi]SBS88096.1 conserved Plasmodium protein, unknown function [Plasmodium ovale curtisi]SCP04123.1 conserved Plasmodium protein, unknown function [Plasmodium ovale]
MAKIHTGRIFPFFQIVVLVYLLLKYEFVSGLYETKAYPFVHLMNNNEYVGSGNYLVKNNLVNLLSLYEGVIYEEEKLGEDSSKVIDNLANTDDETKIERVIKEKIQHINKQVNTRQLVKYSGFIYLYEIIHENNFFSFLHFIYRNNNNGVIIILPESLYIDSQEFLKLNKITCKGKSKYINNNLIEKRIILTQNILLHLKLNQSIYFIKNSKEIENIYVNYKNKFGIFDLTRNVSISPISNNQHVTKINSKNFFFFLSKDNININSVFNKKDNNENFIFTKKKTIILVVDYNSFNIVSDLPGKSTSINSRLLLMNELIMLFSKVYKKEDVNYNILFFFTNYYHGIHNFIDSVNVIFRENIEFVICLDDFNGPDLYIHETEKTRQEPISLFYHLLNEVSKYNEKAEDDISKLNSVKVETQKIKIYDKHLPYLHQYFVLKKLTSFTLSSKNRNSTFFNKIPLIEQKLKLNNLKIHINTIFKAIYLYIKHFNGETIDTKEVQSYMLKYINDIRTDDYFTTLSDSLNDHNKFFVYKDDIAKLINKIKYMTNPYTTDLNSLVMDYKIPHDKKQKYFYQKYVNITFSMAISYIFHYVHFLLVVLFLALVYIFVNFHLVPSFCKSGIKLS